MVSSMPWLLQLQRAGSATPLSCCPAPCPSATSSLWWATVCSQPSVLAPGLSLPGQGLFQRTWLVGPVALAVKALSPAASLLGCRCCLPGDCLTQCQLSCCLTFSLRLCLLLLTEGKMDQVPLGSYFKMLYKTTLACL